MTPLIDKSSWSEKTRKLIDASRLALEDKRRDLLVKKDNQMKKLEEDIKAGRTTRAAYDKEMKEKEDAKERKREDDKKKRTLEREKRDAERLAAGLPVKPKKLIPKKGKSEVKFADDVAILSKNMTRISANVNTYVAAVLDTWAAELVDFSIKNVINEGKTTIRVKHALVDGVRNLTYANFYTTRPTWIDVEKRIAQLDDADKKRHEEHKLAKKEAESKGATAPALKKKVAKIFGDMADEVSFNHYVKQIFQNIINARAAKIPEQGKIKISKEMTIFVSELMADFVEHLYRLLHGEITRSGVKTVKVDMVEGAVENLLNFLGMNAEETKKVVNDKIAQYKKFVVAKKAADLVKKAAETKKKPAFPEPKAESKVAA
jgi:hypothetical protein